MKETNPPPGQGLLIPPWILTSAGASAALVAIGYLVEAARDRLLGVELHYNVAMADYGLVGARFFVDLITLLFRTVGLHPVITGIVLVAATLTALAALRFRDRTLTLRGVMVRFLIILLLLGVKAIAFDIPTALIENVLVERADLSHSFDASPLLDWRTRSMWQSIICAHAGPEARLTDLCKGQPTARHHLESLFLVNVAITLGLLVWAATLLQDSSNIRGLTRFATLAFLTARTIVVVALAIVLLALPYQYGKLVVSTSFNEVVIHFTDDETKQSSAPAAAPAGTAGEQPPVPESPLLAERRQLESRALLLAGTTELLTLYYPEEDIVREVSRHDIESIKVFPPHDVLSEHIARTVHN
ncbi:MAG TPA: hypothetical protein VGR02_02885 [Thermoanaerobaculia bacterium]|jgi:hypothetical protein|nr:hypothetical protein [Thermoanaerobaculia bacterium]